MASAIPFYLMNTHQPIIEFTASYRTASAITLIASKQKKVSNFAEMLVFMYNGIR
jgi:hypothetical protein